MLYFKKKISQIIMVSSSQKNLKKKEKKNIKPNSWIESLSLETKKAESKIAGWPWSLWADGEQQGPLGAVL